MGQMLQILSCNQGKLTSTCIDPVNGAPKDDQQEIKPCDLHVSILAEETIMQQPPQHMQKGYKYIDGITRNTREGNFICPTLPFLYRPN